MCSPSCFLASSSPKPAFLKLSSDEYSKYAISYFDSGEENQLVALSNKIYGKDDLPFSKALQSAMWCSEIADYQQRFGFQVVNDKIELQYNKCPIVGARYFDSAEWEVNSPIYYFSGSWDTQAPSSQVEYHFHKTPGQNSNRLWIETQEGGHHSLQVDLYDCREAIWQDLLNQDRQSLKSDISKCAAKTMVKDNIH